ncbi:hypothetical protein D3C83_277660 [compost metagenome]
MTDLVETLVSAAADAIRNQSPSITSDAGRLKSITIELEISNVGAVIDSTAWTERRGVHRTKRNEASS